MHGEAIHGLQSSCSSVEVTSLASLASSTISQSPISPLHAAIAVLTGIAFDCNWGLLSWSPKRPHLGFLFGSSARGVQRIGNNSSTRLGDHGHMKRISF